MTVSGDEDDITGHTYQTPRPGGAGRLPLATDAPTDSVPPPLQQLHLLPPLHGPGV